jgi:hypothetical protein
MVNPLYPYIAAHLGQLHFAIILHENQSYEPVNTVPAPVNNQSVDIGEAHGAPTQYGKDVVTVTIHAKTGFCIK